MHPQKFQPTHYYTTMGGHPPALEIQPGEIVDTTTLDAHGRDASDRQLADGPNPLTGPFDVRGAQPGDTIAVRIIELRPNRDSCWSRRMLAPHLLSAELLARFPELVTGVPGTEKHIDWRLLPDRRAAEVNDASHHSSFSPIPTAPMLGCIGVAPENGQVISTTTSGTHGGNMDYVGVTAETTLFFPVFVPGAHLYLGDGHATQSHGEIGGSGTEVSMDVRFAVDLRKGHPIAWPRGEDRTYLFAIGNARPLETAVQYATSEMFTWLVDEYGMNTTDASLLMSQSVQYDVGNIFDPAYTMVCKMARRRLPE